MHLPWGGQTAVPPHPLPGLPRPPALRPHAHLPVSLQAVPYGGEALPDIQVSILALFIPSFPHFFIPLSGSILFRVPISSILMPDKGGLSANKFRKSQICNFSFLAFRSLKYTYVGNKNIRDKPMRIGIRNTAFFLAN